MKIIDKKVLLFFKTKTCEFFSRTTVFSNKYFRRGFLTHLLAKKRRLLGFLVFGFFKSGLPTKVWCKLFEFAVTLR